MLCNECKTNKEYLGHGIGLWMSRLPQKNLQPFSCRTMIRHTSRKLWLSAKAWEFLKEHSCQPFSESKLVKQHYKYCYCRWKWAHFSSCWNCTQSPLHVRTIKITGDVPIRWFEANTSSGKNLNFISSIHGDLFQTKSSLGALLFSYM